MVFTNFSKALGSLFDSLVKSFAQTTAICDKIWSWYNIFKSLAGSILGAEKAILLTTYNAIGWSVVNYAAPVWSANVCATHGNIFSKALGSYSIASLIRPRKPQLSSTRFEVDKCSQLSGRQHSGSWKSNLVDLLQRNSPVCGKICGSVVVRQSKCYALKHIQP